MRFFETFRATRRDEAPGRLYLRIVEQARRPEFFRGCGVPDTLDGRFEMVALHAFLMLRRLRRESVATARAKAVAQALFDTMFANMDESLREMGAGDLSVGRKVKQMAEAFYGRAAAYDAGLAGGGAALAAALRRNLFGTAAPGAAQLAAMADYLRREDAALARLPLETLEAARFAFGPPPGGEGDEGNEARQHAC